MYSSDIENVHTVGIKPNSRDVSAGDSGTVSILKADNEITENDRILCFSRDILPRGPAESVAPESPCEGGRTSCICCIFIGRE